MARVTLLHHQLEVADDCATLYLSGALRACDDTLLTTACGALPPTVSTLRLDMHGVEELDESALAAVRAVLRYWRESRNGSFRLSLASECIIATYSESAFTASGLGLRAAPPHVVEVSPFLSGMYV